MDVEEQPVEELLVLRVVSAAKRRRNRRLVTLAGLALALGLAIALPLTMAAGGRPALARSDDRAPIYAAALAAVAPDGATVDVSSIPPGVRNALRSLVGRSVVFGSASLTPTLAGGAAPRTTIVFGTIVARGNRASVPVDVRCGSLCGHGEVLILARRGGRWTVIAERQAWVDGLSRRPAS